MPNQNTRLHLKHIKLLIFFSKIKHEMTCVCRERARESKGQGDLAKSYSDVLLSFMKINRLSEMTASVEK